MKQSKVLSKQAQDMYRWSRANLTRSPKCFWGGGYHPCFYITFGCDDDRVLFKMRWEGMR